MPGAQLRYLPFKDELRLKKECVLVIIGVDERDQKDLIAMKSGYRESKDSWLSVLRDLKTPGLDKAA